MHSALRQVGGGCGLLLLLIAATLAQDRNRWILGIKAAQGTRKFIASSFAEPHASDPTPFALSLICGADWRYVTISTGRPLAWQPSMRDPGDRYVPVEVSVDDGRPQRAALLRESEGTGQLASWMRIERGDVESPGLDEVLRRQLYGFGSAGLPVRRVMIGGLAPDPIEFRMDTLTAGERDQVLKACFAIDDQRLAERACKNQARGGAIRAFEEKFLDTNREWCETTRAARRQQLVDEFLRGIARARNGGRRLAAAFAEFIGGNPAVVVPAERGGTQSCPDPHFVIDTTRLLPILERSASTEMAARHLAELLKEGGVVVSSTTLKFDPPQPKYDRNAWASAVAEAEARCVIDKKVQ